MLDEKQIRLINWMYTMNVIHFIQKNDEHKQGDIQKLKEAIQRRFPEEADEILKEFQ